MGQHARGAKRFNSHRGVDVELLGIDGRLHTREVHLVVGDLVRFPEATLREPAVDRHLPALETGLGAARSRGLSLAAAPGCLAKPRADAAAEALARLSGSGIVGKFVETHAFTPPRARGAAPWRSCRGRRGCPRASPACVAC